MKNYTVSKFENIKSPEVIETIGVDKVFSIIKNGDNKIPHIEYARNFKKGSDDYDKVKTNLIPTFRFNFLFKDKVSNNNITEPTGLIYLDFDNNQEIRENDFIFAKWKSLSQTGYGVLVKVDGLTLENFSHTYDSIGELLEAIPDDSSRKATQGTVQSYDPDIYINHDSKVYNCTDIKKVSSPIKQKKENRGIDTNDTFLNTNEYPKIRYNNIDDYFNDNERKYIVFYDEKEKICEPFVPKRVVEGNRNNTMFIYLSQIAALNQTITHGYLKALAESVNLNAFKPQLPESEIEGIINSIMNLIKEGELIMIYNRERRILFNPSLKLPFKEKMAIVNRELGSMKSEKTMETIYECIEAWDFENLGKITQVSVAQQTNLSTSTIKRYWSNWKEYVKDLNTTFRAKEMFARSEIHCKMKYPKFYIVEPPLKKSA